MVKLIIESDGHKAGYIEVGEEDVLGFMRLALKSSLLVMRYTDCDGIEQRLSLAIKSTAYNRAQSKKGARRPQIDVSAWPPTLRPCGDE